MTLKPRPTVPETVALVLMMAILLPSSAGAAEDEGVSVLFDLGDGRLAWTHVPVPDPANAWCATVHGAEDLGLSLEYSFSPFGVFVEAVEDTETPLDFSRFWGLYEWDAAKGEWTSSMVGALDVPVEDGSAIAWRFIAFGDPAPDANPETRHPWLDFRGGHDLPGRTGSPAPGAGGTFWAKDLGNGPIDSTMVVADGKVFGISGGIYDWNAFEFVSLPQVFALDAEDGFAVWSYSFEGSGGFEIGTVAYRDGVVFATLSNRHVMALDADDGSVVWDEQLEGDGLTSSPTVHGGKVLVGTGGDRLVALDAADGKLNWSANISGWVYLQQPTVHEGVVYVGTDNGTLHALSFENGTELWSVELWDKVRGTTLVAGDRIYTISGEYNGFINTDGRLHALDPGGDEVWSATLGPTGSSPALLGDLVVVGAASGLHAFEADGDPAWSFGAAGAISASPVVAEGRLYVMNNENNSDEGKHTSVIALDDGGTVLWSKVLEPHNWALSSVAVADGRAYVATDAGWVYCLGDTPLEAGFGSDVEMATVTLNDTTDGTAAAIVGWLWQVPGLPDTEGRDVTIDLPGEGDYNVTLTVTDEFGRKAGVTRQVTVDLPDLVAGFTFTTEGRELSMTANDTMEGIAVKERRWSIEGVSDPLTGEEATHRFKKGGDYDVTLTIVDEFDREFSETVTVRIKRAEDGDDAPGPGPLLAAVALLGASAALGVRRARGG